MLKDPPCFRQLIGCSDGADLQGSVTIPTYSSSSASLTIPPYTPSNNGGINIAGIGIGGSNSSRSFSVPSLNLPTAGAKDLFAVYTVDLKNLSSKALSGIKLDHGPIPFGLNFDPVRSSSSCSLLSKLVGCTESLLPSQTKSFDVAYKTTNSAACRINSVLQSIKLASPDATASVRCALKTGAELDALKQDSQKTGSQSGTGSAAGNNGISSSSKSPVSSQKKMIATYTVTLKNAGTTGASNLEIDHGPALGATLKKEVSDTSCSPLSSNTQCKKTLTPSASSSFKISYSVQDPEYCAHHPELKTVRVLGGIADGSAPPTILSTVECAMINEIGQTSDNAGITDSGDAGNTVLPTTGAEQEYFTSSTTPSDYVLLKHRDDLPGINMTPIFWLSCFSMLLIAYCFKSGFSHKSGLKGTF